MLAVRRRCGHSISVLIGLFGSSGDRPWTGIVRRIFWRFVHAGFFSPATTDHLHTKNEPTDLMVKQRIIVSVAERQLRRRERRAALVGFIAGMAVTVALFVLFR